MSSEPKYSVAQRFGREARRLYLGFGAGSTVDLLLSRPGAVVSICLAPDQVLELVEYLLDAEGGE